MFIGKPRPERVNGNVAEAAKSAVDSKVCSGQQILNMIIIYIPHSAVPTLTIHLTPNVTHLPNVTPYNTFFLTCTATSSVVGVGNVAIPKTFIWRRRYGSAEMNLMKLSSNGTIQIVDANLNQSTSTSMLTVTERIPQVYRYRCRVDLDLAADDILAKADVYPITVSGWPLCVFNSHVQVLSVACVAREIA